MAKLDFCVGCGCWIGADAGTIRQGPDGEPEIICDVCLELEQGRAAMSYDCHDSRSGSLDDS